LEETLGSRLEQEQQQVVQRQELLQEVEEELVVEVKNKPLFLKNRYTDA
jgi:hypothetical protein